MVKGVSDTLLQFDNSTILISKNALPMTEIHDTNTILHYFTYVHLTTHDKWISKMKGREVLVQGHLENILYFGCMAMHTTIECHIQVRLV